MESASTGMGCSIATPVLYVLSRVPALQQCDATLRRAKALKERINGTDRKLTARASRVLGQTPRALVPDVRPAKVPSWTSASLVAEPDADSRARVAPQA